MLAIVKARPENKTTRTTLDTIEVNRATVESWKSPPFQRALKVNEKVRHLALQIKTEEVIPGIISLAVCDGVVYLMDGQHRIAAFKLAEVETAFVDVRTHYVGSLAEMGQEFVELNSQLVRFGPDDILRGLEPSTPALALIRQRCPFVGYDQVRRGEKPTVILSMSALLRCWFGSKVEVPARSTEPAVSLLAQLSMEEAESLIDFANVAFAAWGRDSSNGRLWSTLNLIECMWLWRRMVVTQYSQRTHKLTKSQFEKCLMLVSADAKYVDWLVGRSINERDRAPCYSRLRVLFVSRIEMDTGKKPLMPKPAWATH